MSIFFFFKQKTAYEMRISDWSSDVCSSDLCASACRIRARATATLGKGQVRSGPAEKDNEFDPRASWFLRKLPDPPSEIRGESSAVALPIRALSATSLRSASREQGGRRRSAFPSTTANAAQRTGGTVTMRA